MVGRAPRAAHDPGKIIADLAVMLAMGAESLADIAVRRAEPARSAARCKAWAQAGSSAAAAASGHQFKIAKHRG